MIGAGLLEDSFALIWAAIVDLGVTMTTALGCTEHAVRSPEAREARGLIARRSYSDHPPRLTTSSPPKAIGRLVRGS